MRIGLLRHGQAAVGDYPDALRHLTATGRRQAVQAGEALAAQGVPPGRVWCSPLVRAVQTAELAARGWGVTDPLEARSWLADGSTGAVLDALAVLPATRPVLLVGHLPQLGHLARHLTGLPRLQSPSPGTLVLLEGEPEIGECRVIARHDG